MSAARPASLAVPGQIVDDTRRCRARPGNSGSNLAKIQSFDCHVLTADPNATEISLVENTPRWQMHPADQFEAFRDLVASAANGDQDYQCPLIDAAIWIDGLTIKCAILRLAPGSPMELMLAILHPTMQ
jgi:hypothetical protein